MKNFVRLISISLALLLVLTALPSEVVAAPDTEILRPNAAGDETNLYGYSGSGENWERVAEETPDDDASCVAGKTQYGPWLIQTSSDSYGTQYSFQRKSFYANGRFWVFYGDGTYMVYRSSTDGTTWSGDKVRLSAVSDGRTFSVFFDGTYFHYAYCQEADNKPIYYRRGTPNSDGTITWSTTSEKEAVAAVSGTTYSRVCIAVDSAGYPWIGYRQYDGTNYYPYVTADRYNDGTWTTWTAESFPYQLSTSSSSDWCVAPIPLTSRKFLVIYSYSYIKAKRWNGSSWGSEAQASGNLASVGYFSAVNQGDDVHMVHVRVAALKYYIDHNKYTYSSQSWSLVATVQSEVSSTSAPVLSIDPATNNLYCFWAGSPTSKHIYYKKYQSGTWDTDPRDWISESDSLTGNDRLTCFYKVYGNYIGLVYMSKTGVAPYNVKFAYLTNLNTTWRDLYNLPAHTGSGVINKITVYHRDYSDTYAGKVKPIIKTNGVVYEGTQVDVPAGTWTTYSQEWTKNPNTVSAWAWDEIDALQVGISFQGPYYDNQRCTQVYVEVDYTLAFIDITAPSDISGWNLTPVGSQPLEQTGTLTVTCNVSTWTVTAQDLQTVEGLQLGHMTKYSDTTYDTSVYLENAMVVEAVGDTTATGAPRTLPNTAGDPILTGNQAVDNYDYTVHFKQTVEWTDDVVTAPDCYRIVVTFTGSAE